MNVERADFVSVFTRDIPRAKEFYSGTLGLELETEGENPDGNALLLHRRFDA